MTVSLFVDTSFLDFLRIVAGFRPLERKRSVSRVLRLWFLVVLFGLVCLGCLFARRVFGLLAAD